MTAAKRPTTGDEPRRPRLLVADDDPVVRSLLCSQLEGDFDVAGDRITRITFFPTEEEALEAVGLRE